MITVTEYGYQDAAVCWVCHEPASHVWSHEDQCFLAAEDETPNLRVGVTQIAMFACAKHEDSVAEVLADRHDFAINTYAPDALALAVARHMHPRRFSFWGSNDIPIADWVLMVTIGALLWNLAESLGWAWLEFVSGVPYGVGVALLINRIRKRIWPTVRTFQGRINRPVNIENPEDLR